MARPGYSSANAMKEGTVRSVDRSSRTNLLFAGILCLILLTLACAKSEKAAVPSASSRIMAR